MQKSISKVNRLIYIFFFQTGASLLEERIGFLMKTKAGTMPGYERYNLILLFLRLRFSLEFKGFKKKINKEGPLL